MNERIKALAEQVGVTFHSALGATYTYGALPDLLERFAELVRADEREACALLVEGGNFLHDEAPDAKWAEVICKWIRARGEK